MRDLVWGHPQAFLYGQELLLVALGSLFPREQRPRLPAQRLAMLLGLAVLLLVLNRAFLPAGYLLGTCTISHGRYGFPSPLQAWAAAQIPLLWLLGAAGRERLRRGLLSRRRDPAAVAAAVVVPVLICAPVTMLRWGGGPALQAEALLADLGTSLTAASLLAATGSPLVAAAFSSGCLYLATVGISDGEAPFWSIAHVYTSSGALHHLELLAAWLPALLLLPAAMRSARALQYEAT